MPPTPPLPTSPAVFSSAQAWQGAGAAVLPIAPGGMKRPATKWKDYTATAPTLGQVTDWFGNGSGYGLAVIMGAVSGNLELCEIEGTAARSTEAMSRVWDKIDEFDAYDIWHIVHNGYLEESPSGGLHFIYRVTDHPVPGNEKIARRPASPEELAARPDDKLKVLAETRGEGGYVIVAPTSGLCHPSGEAWKLLYGEAGVVPDITWEQRNLLHKVLREALDETPAPAPVPPRPTTSTAVAPRNDGLSPGDDFEQRMSWEQILIPAGWDILGRKASGETHWIRPGKDRREGMSATTGHAGDRDRLYVFSTSTPFQSEVPYTKFGAFTVLHHGGDHSAAARELARLGFGERPVDMFADAVVAEVVHSAPAAAPAAPVDGEDFHTHDDLGNAMRLHDRAKDRFFWTEEIKQFMTWNGIRWETDYTGALTREMAAVTDHMRVLGRSDPDMAKWAKKSRSAGAIAAAKNLFKDQPGVTVKTSAFDTHVDLLNVGNGILNPVTGELIPHEAKYMMTRVFGADYDPTATCPRFEQFMVDVLPDEAMRSYVQRAIGYSLLGRVDQRAMFLVYGPSGTGKSTLMEIMRIVFGDYAVTAASGTFRAKREGQVTNDLHGLRGKRFVTTSETAENTNFDEDTLKRLTGRDRISSRELYEKNQEWTPECALWLATNHPPKFNSDDDAIWRRAKLIPFFTQFSGTTEVTDMARTHLAPEASGILNWILAGVRDFLAQGLGEPDEIRQAADEQRAASDPVARFVEDRIEANVLTEGPTQRIRVNELYQMYVVWAKEMGERTLGIRRFGNRLSGRTGVRSLKTGGYMTWEGIGRHPAGAGIMGTISPG